MKIAYIISSFQQSGPGNVVLALANQLVKQNHTVTIIALSNDYQPYATLDSEVQTINLNLPHGQITAAMCASVEAVIKKLGADVVHSHGIRADKVNSRLNLKVFKLSTSHNNPFLDYYYEYGFRGIGMACYQLLLFRKMDQVIALTPQQKSLLVRFIGSQRVTLINNGVPRIYRQAILPDTAERTRIGVVATLIPRKNIKLILDTFVESRYLQLSLEIYGDGPELTKFKNQYSGHTNINFHGFEQSQFKIFNSIDILLSMSLAEGSPLTVLEAIGADIPVILSDIASHRFICSKLPRGSYRLVPRHSQEKLANLFQMLADTTIAFTDYGDTFKNEFSDQVMAQNYLNEYEQQTCEK